MSDGRTVAEFFAGIGLMRLGLEQAGWRVVWANDIERDKRAMYANHFGDDGAHFALGDVHALMPETIPDAALATASFPCNDLSLAGGRKGLAGAHSSAFWGFAEAIRGMRRQPSLLLLENVTGFLTSHHGRDFESVCKALNDMGYAVDAFAIDAALFVPQSRQRVFIVGSRACNSSRPRAAETRSFRGTQLRPAALADFMDRHPHLHWSIRELPPIRPASVRLDDVLEALPADAPEWWSTTRSAYLLGQMSERHRAIADEMIAGERTRYGTVFRRVRNGRSMAELRTDGIAGCLRTPRGGSGRQILFAGGRGRFAVRLLTPRECARLMGADDFAIATTSNKALFGFGDAVCVPAIRWIADHYLTPLWNESFAPRSAPHSRVADGPANLSYA